VLQLTMHAGQQQQQQQQLRRMASMPEMHSTTILCVRKGSEVRSRPARLRRAVGGLRYLHCEHYTCLQQSQMRNSNTSTQVLARTVTPSSCLNTVGY
jgi:hypothetical protein